ncbi:MAG TPA: hypothetical protein VHU19_13240 [Pyrinomonadaceae bacterium]|jgi:opacity protein-like surface antigen|nr:hypothetical protein [Pyrinomonadaceae bacterium]
MRRAKLLAVCIIAFACAAAAAAAQEESYTSETDSYSIELPSQIWKAVPRTDGVHEHTEFVNGDRSDGYLRVRKEVVEGGASLSDFARGEQDTKLRYLPGFVASGKQERFNGRLTGVVTGYEYTSAGKPMAGRVYYLQADPRTVYVLHFTGTRDKLQRIQNQTDAIARSFRLKQ